MHGANTGTSRSLPQKHFTSGTETTVPGRTRWTDELESGALEERNSRLSASEPTGRAVDTHHPSLPHKQARGPCGHVFPVIARMAGVVVTDHVPDFDSFLRTKFPDAKVICSAIPEYAGTIKPASLNHWSEASPIDVCILRSPMGGPETGSILLSDLELQVNTIAFLAHDLVVLLDPKQIVGNIHDAYEHPHFKLRPYSVLMTGPSGSGDISGIT